LPFCHVNNKHGVKVLHVPIIGAALLGIFHTALGNSFHNHQNPGAHESQRYTAAESDKKTQTANHKCASVSVP